MPNAICTVETITCNGDKKYTE